jgi:type II secretory pathway pseudopilin PulG
MKSEKGSSLLEVMISLALLGTISVLFLGSAMNSAHARAQADERASAKVLAESIIDSVKKMDYSSGYTYTIPEGFEGYSADLTATYMDSNNIQKLVVTVSRGEHEILTLENYKVNR